METIQLLPPSEMEPKYVFATLSEVQDWGFLATGIPIAHKRTKGKGIVVAVLDTGCPNHNDLEGNLLAGLNASSYSSTHMDLQGHGTHCAGIIAACENDSGIIGIAPYSAVLPIKVLGDGGMGSFEDVVRGVEMAIAANVDIISMSLGTSVDPGNQLHEVIKKASDSGIIICAASGNDASSVNFPACYDEVLAICALDANGNMAKFSSRGKELDYGMPGVDVYSTFLNNSYAVLSGTSMACPAMAAVIALLLSDMRSKGQTQKTGLAGVKDMLNKISNITEGTQRFGSQNIGFGVPDFLNVNF